MNKRSDRLYLEDIVDSISKINSYTKGLSFREFTDNPIIIDAVIRNLEIIGEAAKNMPPKTKSLHKEIPWKEMAGMRDKVIHHYFGVDLDIVWKTIKQALPDLKKLLQNI